jgi:hypothetical protein
MPPFESFQRAPWFLAAWARRHVGQVVERGSTGRELELYRAGEVGRRGATRGAPRAGPEATAVGRAGVARQGLGIGGLLLIAVVSFGIVLAGATVLSVLRGGPMTRAGPADRQGARTPEARAGPGSSGAALDGEGSARTPDPRSGRPTGAAGGPGPGGNGGVGSQPPAGGGAEGHAAVSAAARARAELPGRLSEILRIREVALARRDAGLLATIYTADCACLRSGRQAIARLRADHAVWRGRSVSARLEELSRVDDALWIALAVLRRSAFRIEAEDGTLISAEPAARQRYRFALARSPAGTWLLGHASLVEELPP